MAWKRGELIEFEIGYRTYFGVIIDYDPHKNQSRFAVIEHRERDADHCMYRRWLKPDLFYNETFGDNVVSHGVAIDHEDIHKDLGKILS